MNILMFLLIGVAAGFLAGKIMKGGGFGFIGNMVVGVVGAVKIGRASCRERVLRLV